MLLDLHAVGIRACFGRCTLTGGVDCNKKSLSFPCSVVCAGTGVMGLMSSTFVSSAKSLATQVWFTQVLIKFSCRFHHANLRN